MNAGLWIALALIAALAVVGFCLLIAEVWYDELWGGRDD